MSIIMLKQVNQPTQSEAKEVPSPGVSTGGETGEAAPVIAEPEKVEEKTVVLDGPLSRIYSEALNIAYATESYMMVQQQQVNTGLTDQSSTKERPGLYVYVIDASKMSSDDMYEAVDKVTESTAEDKVVVLENIDLLKDTHALKLSRYCDEIGVRTVFSRRSGMGYIQQKLKA